MEILPSRSWKADFTRSADAERYREILRRANEEIRKRDEEARKDEREDLDEQLEAMVVLASDAEVAEFGATLDHYDRATYDALIENEHLMTESRERLRQIFEQAHVMPDGRRVFESEDGIHVFDEHGAEISPEVISAEDINDANPKWETWQAALDAQKALEEDRTAIIEFQDQVADARERVETGELTRTELEDLKASLEREMPDSVLAQLPESEQPALVVDPQEPKTAEWQPTAKLDMPQL